MPTDYPALNHPLRIGLAAEAHSRPFLRLVAPESLTHLAVYPQRSGGNDPAWQLHRLRDLCAGFGVAGPVDEAKYFYHDFGRFRLKWECHTEFATFTFAQSHDANVTLAEAFRRVPLIHVPQQWMRQLDGAILVAAHVVIEKAEHASDAASADMRAAFDGASLAASTVLQGAEVWSDFLIQPDGFSRFVVRDVDLRQQQLGRLVQRVLEIETYRMMALLGLPLAQASTPMLNAIEGELALLTAAMVDSDDASSTDDVPDDEQTLLRSITGLAARGEKLSVNNSYRFSASQAYFRLVKARIEELRESRIDGIPTLGEFMERRLAPAMNTCEAVARRQEALAERIARTNDLLRTRVGIVQEHQNRQILQSMNARAAQQLSLQQAVEGLSVAAVSYYLIGLCSYAGKAAKSAGLPINPDIATGLMVPLVVLGVWLGMRRLHRQIQHK
ncbi:putative membrane-anchored protein [Actimicrobium sp. GrIS 1.19]|uniref:DUF3422 family protein n=1 Tax=Actimicrobium sp. GrIS 1.19 TaxID=3071708 RepID=UPI002E0458B4|nr:putative membrane-anchored protein [Actimicrobium sp. GrIS 1.19]